MSAEFPPKLGSFKDRLIKVSVIGAAALVMNPLSAQAFSLKGNSSSMQAHMQSIEQTKNTTLESPDFLPPQNTDLYGGDVESALRQLIHKQKNMSNEEDLSKPIGELLDQFNNMNTLDKLAALGSLINMLIVFYKAMITKSVIANAGDEFTDDGEVEKKDPRTVESMRTQLIDNLGWVVGEIKILIPSLLTGDMITASFASMNLIEYSLDITKYLAMTGKEVNDLQSGEGVDTIGELTAQVIDGFKAQVKPLVTVLNHHLNKEERKKSQDLMSAIVDLGYKDEFDRHITQLKSINLADTDKIKQTNDAFFGALFEQFPFLYEVFSDKSIQVGLILSHIIPYAGFSQLFSGLVDAKELHDLVRTGKLTKQEYVEIVANNFSSVAQNRIEYKLYAGFQLCALSLGLVERVAQSQKFTTLAIKAKQDMKQIQAFMKTRYETKS